MARARTTAIAFDALSIEGALIAPDMLTRIAALQAGEQSETDYEVPEGLTLRDEIGRYFRIGEALWHRFDKTRDRDRSGIAAREFVAQLLGKVFGFTALETAARFEADGKSFPVSAVALDGRVPIVVAPSIASANEEKRRGIDVSLPEFGDGGRRRSATLLLQEALNASDGALYGLVSDGRVLRLMRDNSSMTRPAWIEADLERIFADTNVDDHFADFSAVWLLFHQSRFGRPGTAPSDCAIERWREKAREEGVTARERLGDGVEDALKLLGNGLLQHRDNESLRAALQSGALDSQGFFQELLRTIYRFIFLFTAEDRGLLHEPGAKPAAIQLYDEGYSIARLRTKAVRSLARDRNHDLFEGVRIIFRALEGGEKRLALPALGGLFLGGRTLEIDRCRVENRFLLAVVEKLGWLREGGVRLRVNWRDMETEELGSVYESLLELTPRVDLEKREFTFASGDETKGHARKTSGSYYTPDSLVQLLLNSALDPVIDETVARNPGREAEALLDLDVIDPACGSGHFLLAAARRLASRIAQLRSPGSPSAEDYRHALREVARHCLYGVDRNPLAVELCQVALWIETVEPGKPLSLFDGRIRQGDSLIGVFDLSTLAQGIPGDAYKALTGDQKKVVTHYRKLNKAQRNGRGKDHMRLPFAGPPADLVAASRALDDMLEDNVSQVAAKARALAEYQKRTGWFQLKTACDFFVAAFFGPKIETPKRGHDMIPTTDHVWLAARGSTQHGELVAEADRIAHEVAAFHWPLMFADVMAKGGFDVVLGNPPWERIKLQEQEFFAARAPEIAAAPNKAARSKLIKALEVAPEDSPERRLYEEFAFATRAAEAASLFAREGGRFPLTGRGDVNTYALFAELFARLVNQKGRAGVIVPTGIISDDTNKLFFQDRISSSSLISAYSFSEVRKWFPGTDDRKPFCLLTLGPTSETAEFSFGIETISELAATDRKYRMTPKAISDVNPNTKTAPIFRAPADAELCAAIYARVPILLDENKGSSGNPWRFGYATKLFDMADDSQLFKTAAELSEAGYIRHGTEWVAEDTNPQRAATALDNGRDAFRLDFQGGGRRPVARYVPLYEAKMIHLFDHRFGDGAKLKTRPKNAPWPHPTTKELSDTSFESMPWYWVSESEATKRLAAQGLTRGWLLGWRDVTNTVSERTLVAAVFPRGAVGHSLRLMWVDVEVSRIAAFLGAASSLVLDFVAKQKVAGIHLTVEMWKQFPILPPTFYTDYHLTFIVPRVVELTYTSQSMAAFARDLGYAGAPFAWDEDRRVQLRAELDAFYAWSYGLSRDQLRYILDPADVKGTGYPSETFRVLRDNEKKKYGEYRTARLVLHAFDELTAKGEAA